QIAIGTRFQAGEASLPFGAERKAAIDQIPQRRSDDTHNENNDQSKESRPQQEMKPAGDAQRPYDIHGEYVSDREEMPHFGEALAHAAEGTALRCALEPPGYHCSVLEDEDD